MSFLTIPSSLISALKANARSIWELIQQDFDDHESRLTTLDLQTSSGFQFWYAGSSVPAGYLRCDGSLLDRASYANLFAIIGTTYNSGGESASQFRLPDRRGKTAMGAGSGSLLTTRTLGSEGASPIGEESHALIAGEIPAHTHAFTDPGHTHTWPNVGSGVGGAASRSAYAGQGQGTDNRTSNNSALGITVDNTGSGTAHNNMQPSLAVGWVISV